MNFYLKNDINEIFVKSSKNLKLLAGKKVLVAGAKGFLGRYFNEIIKEFNKKNDIKISLTCVDNFTSSNFETNAIEFEHYIFRLVIFIRIPFF